MQILSASEGNILEDESAISVITEAKGLGNEITNKQKVAEQTEQEIERARTAYKPSAFPPLRHAACNAQALRACSLRFSTFLLPGCCSYAQ